jgi:hypothetical protein
MSYHFGANEYNHLIKQKLSNLLIINIEYIPDNLYMLSDGNAGKPYVLTLCNGHTFQFRHFQEVINKYGSLKCEKV